MNYWIAVMMNEDELAELVEGDHDLPYALWEKLQRHLDGVRQKIAEVKAAADLTTAANHDLHYNAAVDWDAELDDLLKWGGA